MTPCAGRAGTSPSAPTADGSRRRRDGTRRLSGSGTWPSRSQIARLRGSGGPVTAVVFHPDGQSLATAAAGGPKGRPVVTLWDLASARAIRTLCSEGPDPVEALAFSSDGSKLAAGGGTAQGAPGWVIVWDSQTRAVLAKLDRVGLVKFLAFHPDGARLAVADCGEAKVPSLGPRRRHADHESGAGGGQLRSHSHQTGNGWWRSVTTAMSTLPTLAPATSCWCSDTSARPRLERLHAPGSLSPDGSRIAANAMGVEHPLNVWDLGPGQACRTNPRSATSRAGCAAAVRWPSKATSPARMLPTGTPVKSRAAIRPPGLSMP